LIEKLGSGGYSDVYLYERDLPKLKVAVKVLRADVLDEQQRAQFTLEADVMAELAEHPYIVPVLGAGSAPDGRAYIMMRYYPPPDLGQRVTEKPLTVAEALRMGIQLASAVETAHRSGILHRDIKPGNVLMSSYGVPGLTDFGIAGTLVEHDQEHDLGVSLPWSPQEILTGASNGSVASDIYSLAASVWTLLVGRSPFFVKGGDNSERAMFSRIVHSNPPSTGRADVPSSLDRLLQQAMAKRPELRPRTALDFARNLQRVEQELRFARTETVVLDTVLPAAPLTEPERDHAESTTFRPTPVVHPSEPPAPTHESEATRMRPVRPSALAEPEPATPPAPATQRRPATPIFAAQPQADESVDGDPGEVAEQTPARGKTKILLGVLVAVVLIVAVGIGALLSSGGGGKPGKGPSQTGPTNFNGLGLDLPAPSVETSESGGFTTFRLGPGSGVKPATGDYYVWFYAADTALETPHVMGSNRTLRKPTGVCLVFEYGRKGVTPTPTQAYPTDRC